MKCEVNMFSSRACEYGTPGCVVTHGAITAEMVIAACGEALGRTGGVDVVYVHADGSKAPSAAVVRPGTRGWARLHAYPDPDSTAEWASHDHIEPGMF